MEDRRETIGKLEGGNYRGTIGKANGNHSKASTVFLVKIVGKTGNLQKHWKSMHSQYPRGGIEKKSLEIIVKTKVSQYPRDIGNTLAECISKSLENAQPFLTW